MLLVTAKSRPPDKTHSIWFLGYRYTVCAKVRMSTVFPSIKTVSHFFMRGEDELSCKVLGPAVYTKIYCRVQRNWVLFIPVQWEKSGHTDHEANWGGSAVPHDKAVALAACRQPGGCRRIPYIGSERKNSVRKTGERYKHCEEKSGSVGLRPVEIPPLYRIWRISPAYSCSSTSSWPMSRLGCAVPGRHISVGQMSPGRINYLFITPSIHLSACCGTTPSAYCEGSHRILRAEEERVYCSETVGPNHVLSGKPIQL